MEKFFEVIFCTQLTKRAEVIFLLIFYHLIFITGIKTGRAFALSLKMKNMYINLDYIEYFRNIDDLVVLKENKSGSLQLKIQK